MDKVRPSERASERPDREMGRIDRSLFSAEEAEAVSRGVTKAVTTD